MKINDELFKYIEKDILSFDNYTELQDAYLEYLGYKYYKEKQFELITKIYDYLKEKYPEINEVSVIGYYAEAIEKGYKSFKSIIAFIEECIELKLLKDEDFMLDDDDCPMLYCNYEGKCRTIQ